jgi:hypothetical protein
MNPKIGLSGQVVTYAGSNQNVRAGQVTKVHSATLVDARHVGGTSDQTSIEFVDVGGAAPAAPAAYFQAIDAVN